MESYDSSDSLRNQLPVVQDISASRKNNDDISAKFQQKVDESLKQEEEIISLRSQLKICKETNDLQAAEFTFQRDEMVSEITSLKQSNANLMMQLEKQAQNAKPHSYDINVRIDAEIAKTTAQMKRADKWKRKAREFQNEVETLNSKFENLEESNRITSASKDDLEVQLSKISSDLENERRRNESTEAQITDLKSSNRKLISKLQKEASKTEELARISQTLTDENSSLKARVSELETLLREQQAQNASLEDELASVTGNFNDVNEEYTKAAQALSLLNKKVKKLETAKSDYALAQTRLREMEIGKDLVMRSLEVVLTTEDGDEWQIMSEKARNLVEKAAHVNDLQEENDKLKNRLSVAAEEIRRKNVRGNTSSKSKEDDILIESLQEALHEARDELSTSTVCVENLRLRLKFAQKIDQCQRDVIRQVNDLHKIVTNSEESCLRPLILCCVFAKRLLNRDSTETDPTSLRFFAGRAKVSLEKKVFEIRQRFGELNHDLMMEQRDRQDAVRHAELCAEESKQTKSKRQLEINDHVAAREQIKALESRNQHLQEQLDSYVSPEEHDLVKRKMEKSKKKNKMFVQQITDLVACVEDATEKYERLRRKYKELVVKSNAKLETASEYKVKYEHEKSELNTLRKLLEEKTREILSLERYVQRQGTRESVCFRNIGALAIENQNLDQILKGGVKPSKSVDKTVIRTLSGHGLLTASNCINPAFMGDTCY